MQVAQTMQSSPEQLKWKEEARSTLNHLREQIARTDVYVDETSDPQVVAGRIQAIQQTVSEGLNRFQQYAGGSQQSFQSNR